MSKYYYKGNDISGMISSGNSSVSSFQGFPSFSTTNNNYDKIDVGFANVFTDTAGLIANRNIKANSTTVSSQGTSQISIPTWCNAIKVVVSSSAGDKGQVGGTGTSHNNAGGGNKGTKGEKGADGQRNGTKRTPGQGGQGGEGGSGGSGANGGQGGQGGEGGDGGDGISIYSNNVYVFPSATISTTISGGTANLSVAQSNTSIFQITSNAGQSGIIGSKGNQANSANGGQPGGKGSKGSAGYNSYNTQQGNNGSKGTTGAAGAQGAAGQPGNKGTKGTKGTAGKAGTGTISYSDTTYGNIQTATASSNSAAVTVYFFAT